MAKVRSSLRVVGLHVIDGALILLATTAATRVHGPAGVLGAYVPTIVAVHLLALNATLAYEAGESRRDYRRIGLAMVLACATLTILAVFPPRLPFDITFLLATGALTWALVGCGRFAIDQAVRQAYRRGIGLRRALVIGNLDQVGAAIEQLRDGRNPDQYIVGHVTPTTQPDPAALGTVDDVGSVIEAESVREVIVASTLEPGTLRAVAQACFEAGAALFLIPTPPMSRVYRSEVVRVGNRAVIRLHPNRFELPGMLVKRVFDVCVAAVALVLLSPLMAVIAVAIRLDSPGPAFYRARRVGLGGEIFHMWKFRSMYENAEALEPALAHLNIYPNGTFKIASDPRVTRVGRVLRRWSMDELPQLFNVLLGNMSLVGPRPALPADLERYRPHHFERLTVIPGITGPWQVSGRNLITDFEAIVGMERQYIRSWSILLDVKILLRTPFVVWRGEGAY